jgi:hypothetical protein
MTDQQSKLLTEEVLRSQLERERKELQRERERSQQLEKAFSQTLAEKEDFRHRYLTADTVLQVKLANIYFESSICVDEASR